MTWKTIMLRPYALIWRDMARVLAASLPPLVALVLAFLLLFAGRAAAGGAVFLVALFLLSMLYVELYRRVALPPDDAARPRVFRLPGRRDLKLFGVLFLVLFIDKTVEWFVGTMHDAGNEAPAQVLNLTALVVFLAIWPKLAFVLPAIATDVEQPMRHAWRASRGTYARFWLAMIAILPATLAVVLVGLVIATAVEFAIPPDAGIYPFTVQIAAGLVGVHVLYVVATGNLYRLRMADTA